MKTNTNNQTIAINIKLGTYSNEYVSGTHNYHNLIPGTRITASHRNLLLTIENIEEHEFELYYPKVSPKQIRDAIQTGFNIIDTLESINNMDYAYGDLIKQILAFICLAHHLNLIDDQEAETYLDKLEQINENYYYQDPESNDLDLEIALDTIPNLNGNSYILSFNY